MLFQPFIKPLGSIISISMMKQPVRTRTPRHAAGENPDKRAAIIDGAAQVFLHKGFDAASVSDICAASGVSKSTLYVYFEGKEDLFEVLVEQKRERQFQGLQEILQSPAPIAERLRDFARNMAQLVCSDEVISAHRTVVGIAERRPDIGARFYDGGAQKGHAALCATLRSEIATGTLDIPDPELAAYQFIELAAAGLWRQRLFGKAAKPPAPETTDAAADAAVAVFLAAYAVKGGPRKA